MSAFLFYVTLVLGFNYSALCRKHQDILNTCLDAKFHKLTPVPEPQLHGQHKIRIRNERYLNAPLCSSQCNGWWEACKNEYTCLANWGRGFNWTTGVNTCPQGAPCKSFRQIFNDNATIFCNKIWDFSWRVVPDTQHCLKINFTGANPNDAVARYYANTNAAGKDTFSAHAIVLFLASVVAFFA